MKRRNFLMALLAAPVVAVAPALLKDTRMPKIPVLGVSTSQRILSTKHYDVSVNGLIEEARIRNADHAIKQMLAYADEMAGIKNSLI